MYSDSFSCLQAVVGLKTDHPFAAKTIYKMDQLATDRYHIHLSWVPGKKALNCDVETCLIPHSDLKPLIATHIKSKWQHEWDGNINKLNEIEPSMGKSQIHAGGERNQVLLSCCCIGHSQLTHAFLLKGDLPHNVLGVSPQ